ncbi:Putative transposase [Sinorhizobium sp. NFACC03]|nr:Putative transposase [Sinorhizobium sp. NFACC03]
MFTLPAEVSDIAFQNKALIYDLLFKAASETMLTVAADRKHLGARIGITAVLHTWGSAMTHHPHVHMIVPGGGITPDRSRWIRGDHCCRQGCDEPGAVPPKPRGCATKRPARIDCSTLWLRSRHRTNQP